MNRGHYSKTKQLWGKLSSRVILLLLLLLTTACQQKTADNKASDAKTEENAELDLESRLLLNNATLEQSNAEGQTLWKIQVKKAVYSRDKEVAKLEKVKGNIYHDGKIVLYISADKGEIYKEGEEIFLKDNIVATDPRNGAVIRSQEVEWRPKDNLLIVRKELKGNHAQLEASAKEGTYQTTEQKLELKGDILATAREPKLQLKAQHLTWTIPTQKIISNQPLQGIRYDDKTKMITDQIVTDRAQVDLKAKTITLEQNIEFKSVDPPLQIASNRVVWNYLTRIVTSDNPTRLVDTQDQIIVTGNRAHVDLNQKVAHLYDGVQGVNDRTQAKLYAQELNWSIPTQVISAMGNVIYEQVNPVFNLTGDRAVGTLRDNNIVVTSNSPTRVVTEIYPEPQ
ncbi:protein of unknown function DUF1239 [Gloeothece citriformis PCC 7424]|uniref:LPS export ABC transporter periplasmic protein LptC n=1 Tax=Gloeothece citriformis (strain PCC 7424) TaxID=65393 RepID=B7K984_GLOC7|nr:LPS export ABC transporter periplasmic protein LptC [Gloeothece citriformis]ACK68567.1 protein of unknown function DUF1239 [Gloeothece citriformis PCC 7424]